MTDAARALARFRVEPRGDAFVLVLEDAAGETIRLDVTEEQLDVLADLIDDALGTASRD